MNTQYEDIVERFENVVSLDMVDELMEALQQRRDELVQENEYKEKNKTKITEIKVKIDALFMDNQKAMREVAKQMNQFCSDSLNFYIDDFSGFYIGIDYSDLLKNIISSMKEYDFKTIEEYYNYFVQEEQRTGNPCYLFVNLDTSPDDPEDIYFVDDDNDVIIKRDVEENVILPF